MRPHASLTAAVLAGCIGQAGAAVYECQARVVVGYQGQILQNWHESQEEPGQIRFTFDPASGQYIEQTVGSAALMTDSQRLDILRAPTDHGGDVVAMVKKGSMILRIDDNAHGVFYTRLDRNGAAEIGACSKR